MQVTTTFTGTFKAYLKKLIKLVPDPKGPDCKTASPRGDRTIETIRLHGRKESAVPPGDKERASHKSMPQAKLAVSPFNDNHPKRQDQTAESFRIKGLQDKENKDLQLSLVPISCEVSNSDDDPIVMTYESNRPAVTRLPFSNSLVNATHWW